MTTHYDNSGSEDGQLLSPGDEQLISGDEVEEHDADSLDIKPPQATTHYSRDATVKDSKRREKTLKEKKHSKERRQHKDRSGGGVSNTEALSTGNERERERDRRAAAIFRDGRPEMERYQRSSRGGGSSAGSGYERNDTGRYQKHYDRTRENHATMLHHHNQLQGAPIHLHRRQADYYERVTEYHHHANDYHGLRQSYSNSNKIRMDYGHDMNASAVAPNMQRDRERERERRKYGNYESQQDTESLEQDLRSRLLSKRHKYVKDYDPPATRKHQMEVEHADGYEDRDRSYEQPHKERHIILRHEKDMRNKVIEVFDSPDIDSVFDSDLTHETVTAYQSHTKKHKRREKEKPQELSLPTAVEKRRSPEDAELVARRAKLLVAEREITRRKEVAREELEARREKRRERGGGEIGDELSPTAVAANVTAGLNCVIKRHKNSEKRKKIKKSKHQRSDYEDGENHQGESGTDEHSEAESEQILTVNKRRKHSLDSQQHGKRKKRKSNNEKNCENNEDDDGELTDDEDVSMKVITKNSESETAAESDENFKKSKSKRRYSKKSSDHEKKHRRIKQTTVEEDDDAYEDEDDDDEDDDDDDGDDNDDEDEDEEGDDVLKLSDSPLSIGELSKSSERRHRKLNNSDGHDDGEDGDRFRSSRSRTRSPSGSHSRTHSLHSSTHSSSRSESRSLSRSSSRRRSMSTSRSRSRSVSCSPHTHSSASRSRSRSRSEERDMQANLRKSDAEQIPSDSDKRNLDGTIRSDGTRSSSSPIPCDDKGVALPNYYPGLQGCRSVEEFQCLNRIEEGTYGVVYRAKDKRTSEIVALKRLKMEKEKEGFPITSLREINTLLKGQHPNIVTVREIVVGSNMDKIFIVMDYVEHDLKSLMETMKTRKQCFLPGEVKCLTQQLLSAVGHLHDNWILHRDLKTSNLLLSHKGILKVGDFGLAREYGSPLKKYTSLVVTLWYRAPELLLCSPEYSTPIDIWSVGCIFAEFLQMAPLFPGKSEIDELNRIFKELGTPNDKVWPGYKDLPAVKNLLNQNSQFADYPVSNLRKRFHDKTTELGIAFLHGLLTYDPKQRLNAEAALKHAYFKELPLPIDPSMFPTWPAKSELGARRAMASSPKPPSGGSQFKQLGRDELVSNSTVANKTNASATGFSGIITGNKKTAANTGFVLNAGIEQRQLAMGPGFNLKF